MSLFGKIRRNRSAPSDGEETTWRRLQPFSRVFGFDRGQPIDRHYIEAFLRRHEADVRGRVLEIGEALYTGKFGAGRVSHSDVLHAVAGQAGATLVGDLATGVGIPEGAFDCVILTQTLPFIYGVETAMRNARGALKRDGVLLATFPGISQISRYDMDRWGDYWRFTDASVRRLAAGAFGERNLEITVHGNVLVACAFLHGLASQELTAEELNHADPDYQVLITLRAVNSDASQ